MKIDAYIIENRGDRSVYIPVAEVRRTKTTVVVSYVAQVTGKTIERTFSLSRLRERGSSDWYGARLDFDVAGVAEQANHAIAREALRTRYRVAVARIDAVIARYSRDGSGAGEAFVRLVEAMAGPTPAIGA